VQTIRSESLPGLSSIVIVFKRGTDLMKARQLVAERLSQAYVLPHVSKPPTIIQPRSATSRVHDRGLSSKTLTPIQMSVLARWTIVPRLKGVQGVANVAVWGQRDRQLQVQVDPKKLQDHKISLLQVLETTGNALWWSTLSFVEASTPGSGGFIDTHNQRLGIRHIFPIASPQELSRVPIEGSGVRLGDVAHVVEDHQPLIGNALTNEGAGLLMVVEKFPGMNTLDVTEDVEEALNELLPGLGGMEVNSHVYRPRTSSRRRSATSGWRGCSGSDSCCCCWSDSSPTGAPRSSASFRSRSRCSRPPWCCSGPALRSMPSCSPGSRSPSGSSPTTRSWTWTAWHGGCARPTPDLARRTRRARSSRPCSSRAGPCCTAR
jgi:hypothetical protein